MLPGKWQELGSRLVELAVRALEMNSCALYNGTRCNWLMAQHGMALAEYLRTLHKLTKPSL